MAKKGSTKGSIDESFDLDLDYDDYYDYDGEFFEQPEDFDE